LKNKKLFLFFDKFGLKNNNSGVVYEVYI